MEAEQVVILKVRKIVIVGLFEVDALASHPLHMEGRCHVSPSSSCAGNDRVDAVVYQIGLVASASDEEKGGEEQEQSARTAVTYSSISVINWDALVVTA
jgi:hypothetical protein